MENIEKFKGKKRLFVDQDYVIADLLGKVVEYYNAIFNDNLTKTDFKVWDLRESVKDEAKEYILNFFKIPGFYRDFDVVKDSQRVLKRFVDAGWEVFVITDPFYDHSCVSKREWLREHFPFIDERNYILTGNKSIAGDGILIDDRPMFLESYHGGKILFDAPYNQDEERFFRVYSWRHIERIFDKMKCFE